MIDGGWRRRGDGITRKLVLSLIAPDGIRQWNEAEGWTFEGQLRLWGFDEEALNLLEAEMLAAEASHNPADRAPETIADFAGRIISEINMVRSAIASHKADEAARFALELGATIREFQIKLRDEPDWLRGRKVVEGSRKLKGPRNSDRDRDMAQEFRARSKASGGKSATALMVEIGKERFNLGRSASIEAIRRGLKISSGKPEKPD